MSRLPSLPALAFIAGCAAALALMAVYRPERPQSRAARLVRVMEGIRFEMPPAVESDDEYGTTVEESGPFALGHLSGVASRLGARTRAECLTLMPYLHDRDFKLRFIAAEAINGATDAFPGGPWLKGCIDTESDEHREMVVRFAELIDQLED